MPIALRLIIIMLLVFAVQFYFYKRLLASLRLVFRYKPNTKRKIFFWSAFLYLNVYSIWGTLYFIYVYVTSSPLQSLPQSIFYDYLILFPFWIWILFVIQIFLLLVPLDLITLLLTSVRKKHKEKLRKINSYVTVIISSLFIVYVPFRVIYDLNSIEIRKIKYVSDQLPRLLEGFKITFISDVQADWHTSKKRVSDFINKINLTNPDLVLIGGDIITSTPDYIEFAAQSLRKINSDYGVFSCVGDHDNWAYRGDTKRSRDEVKSALSSNGIKMLDNEFLTLLIDSTSLGILSITDTYVERIDSKKLSELMMQEGNSEFKILLTHQPGERIIESASKNGFNLFLAGHTHGGQVTFLFPFINLTPTLFETKYVHGDFFMNEMMIIVTRGLGVSLVPVRYNSTPEVTEITLINK
ncbi:MAG: metallophosphoesterase [Bacteroidetes bacterium]|nr:metallophosphoesterase [Bacteroidota bacterium]